MMEGLGAAASIIAVIDISVKVIGVLKYYIETTNDAPHDFKRILAEISALKGLFEALKIINDTSEVYGDDAALLGPITSCAEAVHALEKILPQHILAPAKEGRISIASRLAELKWPLKEARAKKLLEQISQSKSTISLALQTEAAAGISRVESQLSDAERDRVVRWLSLADTSVQHNQACRLHDEQTCHWIFRSQEWQDWEDGHSRCLWIHGIPGAGKTILASFLVEELAKMCADDSGTALCYYYCYHGRNTDESDNFLARLLVQLCSSTEDIPPGLQTCYDKKKRPTTRDAYNALEWLANRYEQVIIVLDAVDESQNRDNLLGILHTLADDDRFPNLHLLVTSRDEVDIRSYLSPVSIEISMTNSYVDEDILEYIRNQVIHSNHPRFSRWSPELQQEVVVALAAGAKGMFRWAACQLQILSKLRQAGAIHLALGELPETLDETYERILQSIPKRSKPLVIRALSYLCAGVYLEFSPEQWLGVVLCGEPSARLTVDYEGLLEACVCLVVQDNDVFLPYRSWARPSVRIAHYTVREYLFSERIKESPGAHYALSPEGTRRLIMETAFQCIPLSPTRRRQQHRVCWELHTSDHNFQKLFDWNAALCLYRGDSQLHDRLMKLINPFDEIYLSDASLDPTWISEMGYHSSISDFVLKTMPASVRAATVWQLSLLDFKDVAVAYVKTLSPSELSEVLAEHLETGRGSGSLLSLMPLLPPLLGIYNCKSIFRQLLLRADKVPDSPQALVHILSGLYRWRHTRQWADTLPRLLDGMLDPNPKDAKLMPLQLAAALRWPEAVQYLLEGGADPNLVGTCHGSLEGYFRIFSAITAMSPLHIVRNPIDIFDVDDDDSWVQVSAWYSRMISGSFIPTDNDNEIESLLLQYGAREFRVCGRLVEFELESPLDHPRKRKPYK